MKQAATKQNLPRTAEELDRRFDEGEDVESLGFNLSKAKRPGLEIRRTTLDLPATCSINSLAKRPCAESPVNR
jgi:hypothetical protein